MDDIKKQIQESRAELNKIILEKVKPLRAKLDKLLKEEAVRLCPFKIEEIITLDNGRKGKITNIDYYSLNYNFGEPLEFSFMNRVDEINYIYAYRVDDKDFSITWKISGLRMIQNDTVVGKVPFIDITPERYNVDIINKKVTQKPLNDFIDNLDFLSDFAELK